MLRVAFDDQIFVAQSRGGVSKYFVELMRRLPDHGVEPVILSSGTRNIHLAESGLVPRLPKRSPITERLSWASWRLVGRPRTMPRPLPEADLLHHTFTHPSYLGFWSGPRVTTVFDMTPELFPQYFKLGNPHFAKRRYCEVSDALISISQNTADDLGRLYSPEIADKATVIPLGVGEQFFDDAAPTLELPDRYLLFVGVRSGYKDFPLALEAYRRIAAEQPDLDFVIAGGGPFTPAEETSFHDFGVMDRITHVSPSDTTMPELYARAAAFVFPSIYEGFGLPTLEALASRTPTVLADASCSREIGGDAALYFAPGDVDGLTARVREALDQRASRALEVTGPARAAEFTWDAVAARTAAVYRATLAGG